MKVTQKYKDYLDQLRDSGRINMLGAAGYLQAKFHLSMEDAKNVLFEWMKSCEEED